MPRRKKFAPEIPETPTPGALANCGRCGRLLTVAATRREDSTPFRRSLTTEGFCPDCVMTQFLYNTYPVNMIIDEAGPEMLLNADFMRQAFLGCGVMDRCELSIDEINWQRVVENWNLPVKVKLSGLNPYRMGESPRAQARMAGKTERGKLPPLGFRERRPLFETSGTLVVTRDSEGRLLANGKRLADFDPELGETFENLLRAAKTERKQ